MGLARTVAILNGVFDNYQTDIFLPIIQKIESISNKKHGDSEGLTKAIRIIADHICASSFVLAEGLEPSNVGRGYVLRRLIRRAVRYGKQLGINNSFCSEIAEVVAEIYKDVYPEVLKNIEFIKSAHLKNSITGNYETIPFLIKGKIGSQEIKIAYEIYESTFSAEDKVINDYIGKYQYLDVNKIVLISNAHFSSEVRKIAKLNKITIMQFNEAIDADWTKIIGKDFSVYFQPIHFDNIKDVFLIPVNKDDDTGREMESTNITLLDDKKNEIKSIPNWFLEKVKTNSQLNADIQNKIEADTSGDLYINLKTEGYLVKTNKKDIPIRAILSQLKHVLVLIIMTNGN
ncbi:MAG: hypothetical protein A2474_07110 [Elusimicrobia bacterium RIFOXYC2_FULL_34_12]|nr:MAG: hypothetical protein A2474_07110 [Elusimicrobia bacterium RIFOXYC2_FULL_34_12]